MHLPKELLLTSNRIYLVYDWKFENGWALGDLFTLDWKFRSRYGHIFLCSLIRKLLFQLSLSFLSRLTLWGFCSSSEIMIAE